MIPSRYPKAHLFAGEGLCYLQPGTPGRPETCQCSPPETVAVPADHLEYAPVIPEQDYAPNPVYHYHCQVAKVHYTSATIHRTIRDQQPG